MYERNRHGGRTRATPSSPPGCVGNAVLMAPSRCPPQTPRRRRSSSGASAGPGLRAAVCRVPGARQNSGARDALLSRVGSDLPIWGGAPYPQATTTRMTLA